jgi:DNA-binding response OmpR family regulator
VERSEADTCSIGGGHRRARDARFRHMERDIDTSGRLARPTVLLVEDDALITLLVELDLLHAGFDVVAAGDASSAVAEFERQPDRFRGLITDIRMSGGSGWDIAKRARELSPGVPVVYVTGDSAAEWSSKGVPNSLLVEKPFAPAQVVGAISTLMNTDQFPQGS